MREEASKTILAARVTSVRARLMGSALIILVLLVLTGILYSLSLSRLEQAVAVLEEEVVRADVMAGEQQAGVIAEIGAARRAMRVVPAVWGLLIGAAALGVAFINIHSVAHPVERLTRAVVRLAAGHLDERVPVEWVDEFGRLCDAFNEMADQLQVAFVEMEQRVSERTRDLERRSAQIRAASEVARDAATARELEDLLDRAVNLIRERFGFYHAGIFLVDESGEYAVLRAATGEAGRQMLEQGHRLRVGETGIVGYVTGSGQARVALDVGVDAAHFDNPLLPMTRSEMALPLRGGGEIIGVLDVQSQEAEAFDDEDVEILQTMADQVAVAIHSARLFREMQRTVHELEMVSGRYTRESWFVEQPRGYRYRGLGVEPVSKQPPAVRRAWQQGQSVIISRPRVGGDGEGTVSSLAVPLKLRDQVLGVLNLRFAGEPASSEVVSLVEELADRLALALESARLFEQTQSRARREQTIRRITEQMRRAVDVETILQTTISRLGEAVGAPRVYVRLTTGAEDLSDEGDGQGQSALPGEDDRAGAASVGALPDRDDERSDRVDAGNQMVVGSADV